MASLPRGESQHGTTRSDPRAGGASRKRGRGGCSGGDRGRLKASLRFWVRATRSQAQLEVWASKVQTSSKLRGKRGRGRVGVGFWIRVGDGKGRKQKGRPRPRNPSPPGRRWLQPAARERVDRGRPPCSSRRPPSCPPATGHSRSAGTGFHPRLLRRLRPWLRGGALALGLHARPRRRLSAEAAALLLLVPLLPLLAQPPRRGANPRPYRELSCPPLHCRANAAQQPAHPASRRGSARGAAAHSTPQLAGGP